MPYPETITHRSLPHWYVPGAAHFVTYRLAGTIPADVLAELRAERRIRIQSEIPRGTPRSEHKARAHKSFFAAYDRYLDSHRTVSWLVQSDVAEIIRENLLHHDGSKYHLISYCVMPNHVHVLFVPVDRLVKPDDQIHSDEMADAKSPLARIMHSIKSYTANRANEALKRTGQLWQHESYDHWVRDERELFGIIEYIHLNPVHAGLVTNAGDWKYSSVGEKLFLP